MIGRRTNNTSPCDLMLDRAKRTAYPLICQATVPDATKDKDKHMNKPKRVEQNNQIVAAIIRAFSDLPELTKPSDRAMLVLLNLRQAGYVVRPDTTAARIAKALIKLDTL